MQSQTLRALAAKIFVDHSTLSGYKTGRRMPGPAVLARLCSELRVSADYILGLTDERTPRYNTRSSASVHVSDGTPTYPFDGVATIVEWTLTKLGQITVEWQRTGTAVVIVAGLPFVPIPHLRGRSSASTLVRLGEDIDNVVLAPLSSVHSVVSDPISLGRIICLTVDANPTLGGCMRPTIHPGAEVYVDLGPDREGIADPLPGKLYLIRTADGYTLKRVWRTGEHWNCHCDHPDHAPLLIPVDRRRDPQRTIAGRVFRVVNPLL